MKIIRHLKEELMSKNLHPEYWASVDGSRYSSRELGYVRSYHDGYAWANNWFPVHPELLTDGLKNELNMVYESFRKAFKDRADMARWCNMSAGATADDTEFNAYLELEHGYYWFRMITRRGDYNLYLHCLSRKED